MPATLQHLETIGCKMGRLTNHGGPASNSTWTRRYDARCTSSGVGGYSEASIDRLTEGTGLGRSSLYGTFGGQERLSGKACNGTRKTYHPQYDQGFVRTPTRARAPVVAAYTEGHHEPHRRPDGPGRLPANGLSGNAVPALDAEGQATGSAP